MLGVLLAHPGRRIPIDQLLDWLWDGESGQASTVHTYAKRIRQPLAEAAPEVVLEISGGACSVSVRRQQVDLFVFQDLVSEAREQSRNGDHEKACANACAATALWRDRPFAELATVRAEGWRQAVIRNEWLPANYLVLDEQLVLGRFAEALRRLDDLQRDHGLDVGLAKRRMQVLTGLARQNEMTDYFLGVRRRLRGEGDDQAAAELLRFHDELRARAAVVSVPERPLRPVTEAHPPPRQLPQDIPDFTGRPELLDRLDEETGVATGPPRSAVVVLTGFGGVGKTATAVHWAHRRAACFPNGILFVDLGGFSPHPRVDPGEVIDWFLAASGRSCESVSLAGRAERLRAHLAANPMLIVLDNAADSAHVRRLLPLLVGSVVLITSRHRLGSLGISHHLPRLVVEPLDDEPAAALLAGRIGPRAVADPTAVRDLTRSCGGVPLALHLVAQRVADRRGAELRAVADQLRDPGTLLSIVPDGEGHDESLSALFSLSYQSLAPEHARLFRCLGLHPGAEFGVEAAAALLGVTPAVARHGLDALVGAHLVDQPGAVDRYQMHDLLYTYASSLPRSEIERRSAVERVLNFYLHSAARAHWAIFPNQPLPEIVDPVEGAGVAKFADANAWFGVERVNVKSAVRAAAEFGLHSYAWQLAHATTEFLDRNGYWEENKIVLTIACSSSAADARPDAEASSVNDLGYLLLHLGEHDEAERQFERALVLLADGDRTGVLTVLLNMARLKWQRERDDEAVELALRCQAMARELGDLDRSGKAAQLLGLLHAGQARHRRATLEFRRALEARERAGDVAGQAATLVELAWLAVQEDRLEDGERCCARAFVLLSRSADVEVLAKAHARRAELRLARRDFDGALQDAREAEEVAERSGYVRLEAQVLETVGRVARATGDAPLAWDAWWRSAAIYRRCGMQSRAERLDRRLLEIGQLDEGAIPEARQAREYKISMPRMGPHVTPPSEI
ncbi:BTAD domain-containing putative transcriptional regulator [Amycolatopsis sp. 195334CR]|uniref:BTAD domain-containing putative transcriptional regulator n=1 Tax=Amycolatopsis sp. 195334CR TaxID=2814588 RepID=UPI001A909C57|nr:tetratricopeptide repeat protein [Amycolatopsis sp. 195334CR]